MPKRLTPPAHLPRWLLLRVLAYQVQAAALGGAAGRGGLAAGLQDYGAGAFDDQSGRGRFRRCAIACGTHPARGRRAIGDKKPEIREALRRLVEPATLGDPMRPLIWVSKSLAKHRRCVDHPADLQHDPTLRNASQSSDSLIRRKLLSSAPPPPVERPRAWAEDRQREKAPCHGDVLLHFDHLIRAPMDEKRVRRQNPQSAIAAQRVLRPKSTSNPPPSSVRMTSGRSRGSTPFSCIQAQR